MAKAAKKKPWKPKEHLTAKSVTRGRNYQREPRIDSAKLAKREAKLAKRMAQYKSILAEVEKLARMELHSETAPTAQTIFRWKRSPIINMARNGELLVQEQQAAYEIITAFSALSGAQSFAVPPDFQRDRVDQRPDHEREALARVAYIATYTRWRKALMAAQRYERNPCLAVALAALIQETPLKQIAARLGVRNELPKEALIAALRLFAAMAGNAPKGLETSWFNRFSAFSVGPSGPARGFPSIFGKRG